MKQQSARGKVKKFKGLVTEPVGIVSAGRPLKSEGSALRAEGAVEESHDKARRKVGAFPANQGKNVGK